MKKKLKIWLDDERSMPKCFDYHCKSACELITLINENKVDLISLDHYLGSTETNRFIWSEIYKRYKPIGCGYDVAKVLEDGAYNNTIKRIKWRIHSANIIESENMRKALENADKYWEENENKCLKKD